MKKALVSVIIPCYNHATYLEESLRSVFSQSYGEVEALLINDGSKDSTAEVAARLAKEYRGRVRYFEQENKGPSAARNVGLREASGEYVTFLDADDHLPEGQLEKEVAYLEAHPEKAIVYGAGEYFGDEELITKRPALMWGDYTSGDVVDNLIVNGNFILIHSAMFRRSLLEKVGYFDENLRLLEDWDFWLRCAKAGYGFGYMPEVVVPYRIHGGNVTEAGIKMVESRVSVLKRLLEGGLEGERAMHAAAQLTVAYLGLAARHAVLGHRAKAIAAAREAVGVRKGDLKAAAFLCLAILLPTSLFALLLKRAIKTL